MTRDEPYTVRGHTLQELYDEHGEFIGYCKPLIISDHNRLPILERGDGTYLCFSCRKYFTSMEMYHHSCKEG